jgi:hypothetical protein
VSNLLQTYGITERLFSNREDYESICAKDSLTSLDQLREIILKIAPKPCGHPLIRVGRAGDGGYLVPDDLLGVDACFSPGTSNVKDFEDDLAVRFGIKSFMCDFSSDLEKLKTPLIPGMQHFEKKWLDIENSEINIDINDWVLRNATPGVDLILQMDIEGAEYRNILHAREDILSRFRIIVLEMHQLAMLSRSQFAHGVFGPVIDKLSTHFTCVHAHANNCCGATTFGPGIYVPNVIELTFIRNDRMIPCEMPLVLPHELDFVNVSHKPPLHLDGIWCEHADSMLSEFARIRQSAKWMEYKILSQCATIDAYGKLIDFFVAEKYALGNLAIGKSATQSSFSAHSTAEGASGAVNGVKTGRFGFHTQIEKDPWWMVDLGGLHHISGILLYNRLDACSDRADTLRVLISVEGQQWLQVHDHSGFPTFGGINQFRGMPPLLVRTSGHQARYIRIECKGLTALHLDQVEVFGRPV